MQRHIQLDRFDPPVRGAVILEADGSGLLVPIPSALFGEGTGLGGNQNQTNTSGNFATPRVRNGFLANVLTFKVSRNISSTTKLSAVLSRSQYATIRYGDGD